MRPPQSDNPRWHIVLHHIHVTTIQEKRGLHEAQERIPSLLQHIQS